MTNCPINSIKVFHPYQSKNDSTMKTKENY